MTYAQIDNTGTVVNVIVAQQTDVFPDGFSFVQIDNVIPQPGVGWGYSDGSFTSPFTVTLASGVAQQMSDLAADTVTYLDSTYNPTLRQQILGLYIAAVAGNLSSRAAYLLQFITWLNSVTVYVAQVCVAISAAPDIQTAQGITWNLSKNSLPSPNVSIVAAIQILD